MKTYVPDTSVIIEKIVSNLIKNNKIKGTILIPNAVVAEIESQANKRRETGFLGLDELKELQELKKQNKIDLQFIGNRPTVDQIKFAKSGEIDALIRQIAYEHSATLITADIVQAESARVYGLEVEFIKQIKPKTKLSLEKYFDNQTMSIHLKEGAIPVAKRGLPGNWKLIKIAKKPLKKEKLIELSKEIIEKTKMDSESFIEISRPGSTVVQYKNYRIVIVRTPISSGLEITAIKPIKKLTLKDYKIDEHILDRIKTQARGVLIAGEVGSGKSTFAQAIAEFYSEQGKITKTVESPRDLQVSKSITQYSKNFSTSEEIHDILFLSRPDNILFDEIRDTPDFKLFTDLRLGGSNCLGVIHSASAIDSIQRFIPRIETGMIPSVIDTIIFMESGKIESVLTLKITVKTPSGMTEADLARPVIEVYDFLENKLSYEIYSYGEDTVVIPVTEEKSSTTKFAEQYLDKEFKQYSRNAKIEIKNNRATVYVPEKEIPKLIGVKGKRISNIEEKLGIRITIKETKTQKETINYHASESKKFITFTVPKSLIKKSAEIKLEDNFLFSSIVSNQGKIQIHKKSQIGRTILEALDTNKKIEIKI
ncbi:Flp pilus assembly complex ATPase component TadA [Candidatus Woesearchaeota archaeon]|jgi:ATPase|nr:Flp pilus assembly complex ATPase component TadA [Cryomorphaceae bacterium]MBT6995755.1 Flp pilus assembly complex ATPase component TadA [Candidatus Woesearchaeota archaeon]MBT7237819.1 Flp pilus assembly complex ATPase component TadA [Candidatus Woesearchaeota archaeon]